MIQVGPFSRRDRELSPVPYNMTRRCLFLKKMQNVGRKGGRFWCSCKLCWVLRTRFNTCGSTIVHTGLFSDSASIVSNRNLHWVPGVSILLTEPAQLKWRKVTPSKLQILISLYSWQVMFSNRAVSSVFIALDPYSDYCNLICLLMLLHLLPKSSKSGCVTETNMI